MRQDQLDPKKLYTLIGWNNNLAIVLPNLDSVTVQVALMDAKNTERNYHTILEQGEIVVMYKSQIKITHEFEIVKGSRSVEKDE